MYRSIGPVVVLFGLFITGCQTTTPRPDPVAASNVQAQVDAGDYRAAGTEYERLARENRKLRDHYNLLAAEAWREEAELDDVARLLAEIKRKKLDPGQNLRFDLLEAEIALSRQQAARASTLLAVPDERIPEMVLGRWLELQARAFAAEGRILDAGRTRLRLIEVLPRSERRAARRELLELIAADAPDRLRTALLPLAADDTLRPWLERALRSAGEAPARAAIAPNEAVDTMAPDQHGEMQRTGFASIRKVAVLLPVTGEFAAAGKAILDGVLSAHFQAPIAAELQVFDAGGTRRSALDAYAAALADGVDAVIGPVERDQVDAILDIANQDPEGREIRLLTLNHPEPKTIIAGGSARFGLLPEDEAAFAAEQFIAEGAKRVAVFGTNEDWSERAMAAFDAQLRALGGVSSGRRMLRDSDVEFSEAIAAIVAAPSAPPGERLADAVFLAVRPSTARLLLPQLRAAGLLDLPTLATSHVFAQSAQVSVDKDLDDLVFLDVPWTHGMVPSAPPRSELAETLGSAAGSPRLFAFGLDAYRLLPWIDHLRERPGRYVEGASGTLISDAFGRIRRLPQMFRFVNGVPQSASGLRLVVEPEPVPLP
jgi:outer membrane PBP1 activator LpoA protein